MRSNKVDIYQIRIIKDKLDYIKLYDRYGDPRFKDAKKELISLIKQL